MDSLEKSKDAIEAFMKQHDDAINRMRETALQALDRGSDGLIQAIQAIQNFQSQAIEAQFPVLGECLHDIWTVLKSWHEDPSILESLPAVSDPWADVIYELSNFLVFLGDEDPIDLKQRVGFRLIQLAKAWTIVANKLPSKKAIENDGSWGLFEESKAQKGPQEDLTAPPAEAAAAPLPPILDEEPEKENLLASHYLICMLGSQQYALPIHQVREILERRPEKFLPLQRSGIVGLVTVRGLVCPVVDISHILYSKQMEAGEEAPKKTCMVVCEVDRRTFCFNVDDVKQVAAVNEFQDQITPLPHEKGGQRAISHVSHFQEKSVLFVKMREVIPA